jgi:hypothetical protein
VSNQLNAQTELEIFSLLDSTSQIVLKKKKAQFEQEGICSDVEQKNLARKEALRLLHDYVNASLDAAKVVDSRDKSLCLELTYEEKLKQSKIVLDSILSVRNLVRLDFVEDYIAKRVAKAKR